MRRREEVICVEQERTTDQSADRMSNGHVRVARAQSSSRDGWTENAGPENGGPKRTQLTVKPAASHSQKLNTKRNVPSCYSNCSDSPHRYSVQRLMRPLSKGCCVEYISF